MMGRRAAPILLLAGFILGWATLRTAFLAVSWSPPTSGPMPPPFQPLVPAPTTMADGIPLILANPGFAPRMTSTRTLAGRRAAVRHGRPVAAAAVGLTWHLRPVPKPTEPTVDSRPVIVANRALLARMLAPLRPSPRSVALSLAAGELQSPIDPMPDFSFAAASHEQRWQASAWLALRSGNRPATFGAAALGGSQAGARLAWQPGSAPAAIFGRVVSTGHGRGRNMGAEAAIGAAVRPMRRIPIELVAERRIALSSSARNAFAVYAVGGGQSQLQPDGWRVDAYGAAGVVGLRRRDLFAEGAVRVDRPMARLGQITLRAGGGVWGAAQTGATRLDVGPTMSAEMAGNNASSRLSVDWRQRLAGNATPPSGPALTIAMGF